MDLLLEAASLRRCDIEDMATNKQMMREEGDGTSSQKLQGNGDEESVEIEDEKLLAETNDERKKQHYCDSVVSADDDEDDDTLATDQSKKQSSDQHNENERKRRKSMKHAVNTLREQLTKKTRRPAVNTVLRAAYEEIQDLKSDKEEKEKDLEELKRKNIVLKYLLEKTLNELKQQSPKGECLTIPPTQEKPPEDVMQISNIPPAECISALSSSPNNTAGIKSVLRMFGFEIFFLLANSNWYLSSLLSTSPLSYHQQQLQFPAAITTATKIIPSPVSAVAPPYISPHRLHSPSTTAFFSFPFTSAQSSFPPSTALCSPPPFFPTFVPFPSASPLAIPPHHPVYFPSAAAASQILLPSSNNTSPYRPSTSSEPALLSGSHLLEMNDQFSDSRQLKTKKKCREPKLELERIALPIKKRKTSDKEIDNNEVTSQQSQSSIEYCSSQRASVITDHRRIRSPQQPYRE